MALCAGIAALALTLGVLRSLPGAARRLGTITVPVPVRPIAAVLMAVSLIAMPARPRAASATVAPPIVRLADGIDDTEGERIPESLEATGPARWVTHVVEPGDSLWRIAGATLATRRGINPSSAEIAQFWPSIYEANRAVIGADPNLILPGQHLEIPEA